MGSPPGGLDSLPPCVGKVADFSIPELQQVLHATLERISNAPEPRAAYAKGKLPVVGELLPRTEPKSAEPSSNHTHDDSRAGRVEEAFDDTGTVVDVELPTTSISSGKETQRQDCPTPEPKAVDFRLDLPPSNPWFPGNAQHSFTVRDFSGITAHPPTPLDERQQMVAAQNLSTPTTSGPDAHAAPLNPLVSDRRALTTNVSVRRDAPRVNPGRAPAPPPRCRHGHTLLHAGDRPRGDIAPPPHGH